MNSRKAQELYDRAAAYLSLSGGSEKIKTRLGDGTDGCVWRSTADTAVKAYWDARGYWNEKDTYIRLKDYGYTKRIGRFWVPKLIGCDDDLMVVEMDIVQEPPYIIDFAKVRLNFPPEFSEDVLENYHKDGAERFGHNWPKVCALMEELESIGIYYLDPRPGNIMFPDMP